MKTTRAARRAWWESLSVDDRASYIDRLVAKREANPSPEAREAIARLDLATERGIFMREVPDKDVAERMTA